MSFYSGFTDELTKLAKTQKPGLLSRVYQGFKKWVRKPPKERLPPILRREPAAVTKFKKWSKPKGRVIK